MPLAGYLGQLKGLTGRGGLGCPVGFLESLEHLGCGTRFVVVMALVPKFAGRKGEGSAGIRGNNKR